MNKRLHEKKLREIFRDYSNEWWKQHPEHKGGVIIDYSSLEKILKIERNPPPGGIDKAELFERFRDKGPTGGL